MNVNSAWTPWCCRSFFKRLTIRLTHTFIPTHILHKPEPRHPSSAIIIIKKITKPDTVASTIIILLCLRAVCKSYRYYSTPAGCAITCNTAPINVLIIKQYWEQGNIGHRSLKNTIGRNTTSKDSVRVKISSAPSCTLVFVLTLGF